MTSVAWSRMYLFLWVTWMTLAAYLAVVGGQANRKWWWGMVAGGLLLEGIGFLRRGDRMPMLTEVFGRYVPPWALFPVLALALWRLSQWVPDPLIYAGGAWQNIHFIQTYHTYQKLGREVDK